MSKIDAAAIRKIVRSMAAKESVDRRIIADLLIQIGIIPGHTSLQNKKMYPYPFKLSLGEVFRGDFDCQLSSDLHKLFPSGLSHISDQLESSWLNEHLSTEDTKKPKISRSSIKVSTPRNRMKVEECFVLDVKHLEQWGILRPTFPSLGFMLLFKTLTGAPLFCTWEINRPKSFSSLNLTYLVPDSTKVDRSSVEIWSSTMSDKTQTLQYWMKCPHEDKGSPHRRLLYLPPGADKFKCNQCYNLDHHRSRSMVGLDLSVPFFFLQPE